jgi:hypothetical protein
LENVGAKSPQPRDTIANVNFGGFLKALLLAVRHYRERHVERIFLFQAWRVGHGVQLAANAHYRKRANFKVQIRSALAGRDTQEIVNS